MEKIVLNDPYTLSTREKEEYRTLRTNLEFTGLENQIIAITSCTPNDGKSTVAYNLASSIAESGKSALIIDADMRKSIFLQRYQVQGKTLGLSHLLSGQATAKDVIYSTNKNKLFVLPSGKFPSNPTELLVNGRFEKLLAALKSMFDYIIIDTPPIGSVIDAAVIAKQCDASMLVLAANISRRKGAKKAVEQMKAANPNFLGVVLNKVSGRAANYYYSMVKGASKYFE